MGPKRKRSPKTDVELSQPTRRRRSGRFANFKADFPEEDEAEMHTLLDADGADVAEHSEPERVMDNSESVRRVMRELSEFEQRLQNEVKRQRIAIASSKIMIKEDTPGQSAFKPGMGPTDKEKTKLQLLELESAPMDMEVAEYAARDIVSEEVDIDEGVNTPETGARRPPAVNSNYLPLPWKGRLGYSCLNTYLRAATPPIFSSRTCRIESILEHQHPLQHPSLPEHSTKNPPDRMKPAEAERGQRYIYSIGLANARAIPKMLKWNDKYGIKFMRLSSDMFPFASHPKYGYKLAPFASEALDEAGRVAAELGHRVSAHPGIFTQLGSSRPEVIDASIRDIEYHDEMLTLLRLPRQQDLDAVIVVRIGGTYGDRPATVTRFKANYDRLSPSAKRRLVLENDDVAWSVHDLLPICENLNIPLVLDFHHHNIIFDSSIREGTADLMPLFDRIRATWTRKGITQKMHYSEPCVGAVTLRDRRKHAARVRTLPPCPPDMDLMIDAGDKEQAIFELMRNFKLPGYEKVNDIIPYERDDEDRTSRKQGKSPKRKSGRKSGGDGEDKTDSDSTVNTISLDEFGMGGPQNRVYWPEGHEDWLKPEKREPRRVRSTTI